MKKKCIRLTIACSVIVIAAIIIASGVPLSEEALGEEYLVSLGYTPVYEESSTYKVPEEEEAVFDLYNELQKDGGFDLSQYRGETLMRVTYFLTDYGEENVYANLLFHKRKVVGGDISQRTLNGFMLPLGKPQGQ